MIYAEFQNYGTMQSWGIRTWNTEFWLNIFLPLQKELTPLQQEDVNKL
jgi:hypothetical protein